MEKNKNQKTRNPDKKTNAMNNLDNSDVKWYWYGPNGRLTKLEE